MIEISLLNVPCLILCSLLPLLFLPLFLPPSLTTFRTGKIECAPITRENLVLYNFNSFYGIEKCLIHFLKCFLHLMYMRS